MGANPTIYLTLIKRCQCIRRGVDVSSKGVNVTEGVSVYPYPINVCVYIYIYTVPNKKYNER